MDTYKLSVGYDYPSNSTIFLCYTLNGFFGLWENFGEISLENLVRRPAMSGTHWGSKEVTEVFRKPFSYLVATQIGGELEITPSQFGEMVRRVFVRGQTVFEAWETVKLQKEWIKRV